MKTLIGFSTRDVNELNRKEFSIKRSLDEVICRSVVNGNVERFLRTAFGVNIEFASARTTSDERRRISYGQLEFESFVALIGDRKVKSENSAKANAVDCVHEASFIHKNAREMKKTVRFSETHADRETFSRGKTNSAKQPRNRANLTQGRSGLCKRQQQQPANVVTTCVFPFDSRGDVDVC